MSDPTRRRPDRWPDDHRPPPDDRPPHFLDGPPLRDLTDNEPDDRHET